MSIMVAEQERMAARLAEIRPFLYYSCGSRWFGWGWFGDAQLGWGSFASALVMADLRLGAVVLTPERPADLVQAVDGWLEPGAEQGDDVADGAQ
ncbi:MAG TPA: hypothetical protein VI248_12195 [Kineosporiaceae bacterium]